MNSIALNADQFGLVYNVLSFGLVSMLACTIYTLVSQSRVLPKYRTALVMSSMVTFIAAYHYWRIFNSFESSYVDGAVKVGTGKGDFNEGYRYVDWIRTVPLLLVEVVHVTVKLMYRLFRQASIQVQMKERCIRFRIDLQIALLN